MKKNNNGFSLVELIVVIAIMAVLVGVIAPQYLGYVERTKVAVDQANVDMLNSVTQVYYANNEESNPFTDTDNSNEELIQVLLDSGELTSTIETKSDETAIGWNFDDEKWYLNGPWSVDRMDLSGARGISKAEAIAAGYTMPIYEGFWLYEYMIDGDKDGIAGE